MLPYDEYLLEDGSSPYKAWFDALDVEAAAKVTTAKVRMERGLISAIKWFDGIGEYKIDWGPGYRIYLAQDGEDLLILFGGGTKKGQNEDIKEAKRLHEEYKIRKAAKAKADKLKDNEKSNKTKKKDKLIEARFLASVRRRSRSERQRLPGRAWIGLL